MVIVQVRASAVRPGDVINRRGPDRQGWIEVDRLEQLPDGDYVVHDETGRDSFTATEYDLVWLQTLEEFVTNSHFPMPTPRSQLT